MLFIETSTFTKQLPRHLDDDSYAALQAFLSVHPDAGNVIRGTGGIRKIRWAIPGAGKRGGSRVIYYWAAKDDLTAAERDAWRRAVEAIDHD